jgi:glucuronoarabinoxylan endo-1,4-beta-xylanase
MRRAGERVRRRWAVPAAAGLALLTVVTGAAAARGADGDPTAVVVDGGQRFQTVDGFGFSEAFQRSNILHGSQGLSPANQQRVLDLLFRPDTGAGFSILRNGIGSSPDNSADHMASIEPVSPGGPDAPPRYVWDGSDNSQVWLAQQAQARGVRQIYADAWSAPGYMKTNGSDANGGYLCGVPGATCASGDWRQAYADYLVQYLRFYQQAGVRIDRLGFLNEPDLAVSYASMQSDGAQAADFLKVLGPTLARSGLPTKIACCDAAGWQQQAERLAAIEADPAAYHWLDLVTGHGYSSPPSAPLATDRPVWQSEWADFGTWDPSWDGGGPGAGLRWAQEIQSAFTAADVNAFLYWWGASASTANSGLVRLDGDSYTVSKRLWAFAAFSRFVRPGAVRIGATSPDAGVTVSAFRNHDGSTAIQIINTGTAPATETVRLRGATPTRSAQPYLTDTDHDLAAQGTIPVRDGGFTANLPPRSLLTYVLTPGR